MTLEDAIAHAREVTKDMKLCCEECASEYEQLAKWLEELAEYQKLFESPKEAEEVLNMLSV